MLEKGSRYEVCPREIPTPDGAPFRFYELYEIMMVDGIEKPYRNMDKTFKTEEEATAWIEEQAGKRC